MKFNNSLFFFVIISRHLLNLSIEKECRIELQSSLSYLLIKFKIIKLRVITKIIDFDSSTRVNSLFEIICADGKVRNVKNFDMYVCFRFICLWK